MKARACAVALVMLLFTVSALTQEKVAEGVYGSIGAAPGAVSARVLSKWILYAEPSGGYRLESEIQNQPSGVRLVQVEKLTAGLVPTSAGYKFYRGESEQPEIEAACSVIKDTITCQGQSGESKGAPSEKFKVQGPFWMWFMNILQGDMPWLYSGAFKAAGAKGPIGLSMVIVSGGTSVSIANALSAAKLQAAKIPSQSVPPSSQAPWSLNNAGADSFDFVGEEMIELGAARIKTKHYARSGDKSGGAWVTDSGLVVKLSLSRSSTILLSEFRQYRNVVPEIAVSPRGESVAPVH